jgi:shikimate kinase
VESESGKCGPRRAHSRFHSMRPPPLNIVLIGFMGSGKSSIGRRVASGLGFQFVDTDALLVERDGREIAEIFAQDGEVRFRDLETSVLESLSGRERCVISTGGGVVLREENRALLRELGFVVWLTASEDVIFERVSRTNKRPLLRTANPRETVNQLFAARRPLYEAAAQFTLDTTTLAHGQAADAVIAEARRAFSWDTAG